jgi:hypothetical protein
VIACDAIQGSFAGQVLESRGGIDQPSVEEDPPAQAARLFPIGQCQCHCPAREGGSVNPR